MSKKRVLLVDDDEVLRELLSIVLSRNECEVLMAKNGQSAQEVMGSEHVDMVVLDLMMPVMDGMRFLKWLRQEQASEVPVLIMSAMEQPGIKEELHDMGASAVLFKPVEVPELLRMVKHL